VPVVGEPVVVELLQPLAVHLERAGQPADLGVGLEDGDGDVAATSSRAAVRPVKPRR
jgi:hypothetical protein